MRNVDQMVKEAKERRLKEYQENVRLKEDTAFANHMGWSDVTAQEYAEECKREYTEIQRNKYQD